MPQMRISCPNCRQPVMAEINQLFDVGADPTMKSRFLSGTYNIIQCPYCGFQGRAATPIVYHDPEKELLLTFVPPEIGMSRNEQERMLGVMINQAINHLPQEKRKAYLLQPQSTLTLQGLVERVLEADGITREMIQAQQDRLALLQRLMDAPNEKALAELAENEDSIIDADFFAILQRIEQAAVINGDEESIRKLGEVHEKLLSSTTFGREIKSQSDEVEQALSDLRALGKDLNREKLLDLVMKAPNEIRLRAYVSLTRPIMDYTFFQLLSEKIDRARGDGRTRLVDLRTTLLSLTQEIDQQIQLHVQEVSKIVDRILGEENIEEAMNRYLPALDDYFMQEIEQRLEAARKSGDLELIGKLQKIIELIQQASAPTAEIALIEELLQADDERSRRNIMQDHQEEITPEFLNILANLTVQAQNSDNKALATRIMDVNRLAVRFSMEKKLG